MDNLPCPFCGSTKLSEEELILAWDVGEGEEHVVCDECAASAPADVWNRRKEAA